MSQHPSPTRIRVRDVQRAAARVAGLPVAVLISERRSRDLVEARQIAMAVAAEETTRTIAEVGRLFHRDHTTVLHAIAVVRRRAAAEPAFAALRETVRAEARSEAAAWLAHMRALAAIEPGFTQEAVHRAAPSPATTTRIAA